MISACRSGELQQADIIRNGPGVIFFTTVGQGDGSNHRAAKISRSGELQQADIIRNGPGVIFLVQHDLADSNVHLVRIIFIKVMVSNTDSKTAGRLSITAVTSGDNFIRGNKRSTAHEGATNSTTEQSNLMRELSWAGLSSSNNLATSSAEWSGKSLLGEFGCASGNGHNCKEYCCSHD